MLGFKLGNCLMACVFPFDRLLVIQRCSQFVKDWKTQFELNQLVKGRILR
jgi:hypothetical protein